MDLAGSTTLITGGARGIGRGIALEFAKKGSHVAIADMIARPDIAGEAEKTLEACRALGVRAHAVQADVTDETQLSSAVEKIQDTLGDIETVVANAGILESGLIHETSVDSWQRVLDVNLTGAWLTCRAVVPHMLERKSGSLVLISSVAAYRGAGSYTAYCATKSGLLGLAKALSHELAPSNVRVNVIAPGYLGTEMWIKGILGAAEEDRPNAEAEFDNIVKSTVPLGREQTASDIGQAATYFASAINVTGAELVVDGGRIAGP